jgi:hypothetical protein
VVAGCNCAEYAPRLELDRHLPKKPGFDVVVLGPDCRARFCLRWIEMKRRMRNITKTAAASYLILLASCSGF